MSNFVLDSNDGSSAEATTTTAIEDLIDHVTSNGGDINYSIGFELNNNEGYGIFAKEHITKNSTILSIPLSLCITTEAITSYPKLRDVFVDNPSLLSYPDEVLAIGLLYTILHSNILNNNSSSIDSDCPWLKHVATMPLTFNTPLYWSAEELTVLSPHIVFTLTNMMKQQMVNDYNSIYVPLASSYPLLFGSLTFDLYVWALSIVYSRAIDITIDNNGTNIRIIVPLLDLANHRSDKDVSPSQTFHYDDKNNTINLITHQDLKDTDEYFAVYGKYCNSKLLYTYGFIESDNCYKAIDLYTKLQSSSSNYERKFELLQSHPLTNAYQNYDFSGTIRSKYISLSLLATIRVIQADSNELHSSDAIANAFSSKIVSVRNELATYASLKQLIIAKMRVEDAQKEKEDLGKLLLDDTPVDDRKLMALKIKVEERELLEETLRMLEDWKSKLEELGEAYTLPL